MGKEGTFQPASLHRAGVEDEVSILNRVNEGQVICSGQTR
jgi:hypothetical protein